QSKYILDILKRFGMENCDTVPTPMVKQAKLKLDLVEKPVDHTDCRKESKYVAVSSCCAQVLWMPTQLTDYGFFYDKVSIYCDSKSEIAISCNPEDINLKFLRSLPSEWRTHTLIWRNKTDLEVQSLEDLFNSLKIYEAEVKSSSSASTLTQNIAFVSSSNTDSTNESVSAAASVSAVSVKMLVSSVPDVDSLSNAVIYSFFASQSTSPQLDNDDLKQIDADDLEEMDLKWQMAMLTVRARRFLQRTGRNLMPVSSVPDVDSLSNAVIYSFFASQSTSPQLDNDDLKQIDVDDLKEMDLKWQMAMLTVRARRFLQRTGRNLGANRRTSIGFDMSKVEYAKPTNYALMAFSYSSSSSENEHAVRPPYSGTFMPPKPDLVFNTAPNAIETDHPAFNVKLSPTKPDQDLSHTNRPSAPIIEDWVSDPEDESETKTPQNVPSFVQPPRPSVQHVEITIPAATPKPASPKPTSYGKHRNRNACFVCKRYARKIGMETKMPNFTPCFPQHKCINDPKKGNPQHALKDKGVIDSGWSRHMTGNMSYLSDFEELNGGYVTFGGNPKGGKISEKSKIRTRKKNSVLFTNTEYLVLSPEFKLPDESQVLLRVPRENNTYNVNLKNIVPSGDLTCLFVKATINESNIWHRRLGHIKFKTMKKLVKDNLVRGLPNKVFENDNTCVACKKGKQHRASCLENQLSLKMKVIKSNNRIEFKNRDLNQFRGMKAIKKEFSVPRTPQQNGIAERKNRTLIEAARTMLPKSEVNVSPSSSAQSKKHDDKTKREAKGKSLIKSLTRNNDKTKRWLKIKERGYIKILKIQVGLKLCTRSFFNSRCRRNKAQLVAQGHTQEEGTDYKEVFAPIVRIEAIRLFLAYASFMGFMVYQMDVKSAFLYGTIEEEVYVCQPSGFEDPDYPDKVYKVVKALYGLHQAPRAWYETLANYLLENGFQKGKIDKTLFIKRQKGDILLVQIYVDDIIFGSTNKDLCKAFEKLMKDKFQLSTIGELTFFLGLQVKQKKDGIFISHDKYVAEILRKFRLTDRKSASTPIDTKKPLLKDPDGEDIDVHTYRSMISSLMYLTSSRPDIVFVVCACAHFQVTPKASHLHVVKRIFRYLKGKPHLGLWYTKDSPFDLVAYSDSDYASASLDRKSTTRGCQFLGCRLISWQCKKQTVMATSSTEAEYIATAKQELHEASIVDDAFCDL
nr:putative ribonuclease H-like domain-containing protein [Tanacetum cinerariifolium]